jgi:hypothetical protein
MMDKNLVREPNMPVGVFIQEAYNIHFLVQDDREQLEKRGLDWGIVDELPARIEHLRLAEARWWKARFAKTPLEKEYERWREKADAVSRELFIDLEYALTGNAKELHNLRKAKRQAHKIAKHGQDCGLVHAMANCHRDLLAQCGSNPALLEDIAACANKIPQLVSQLEISPTDSWRLTERNFAYTFLLVAVEEIKRCARYAFWSDREKLRGYASEYFRKTPGPGRTRGATTRRRAKQAPGAVRGAPAPAAENAAHDTNRTDA